MDLKSYTQLRKLMMLTHSDNDTEALAALRKANALLREHSYDWNSAFDRLVKVESPIEAAHDPGGSGKPPDTRPRTVDPETLRIENAFTAIDEMEFSPGFEDFLGSLKNQWDRVGRLTAAQKEALFKAADV